MQNFKLVSTGGFEYNLDDKRWYNPEKLDNPGSLCTKEYWETFLKNHAGEETFEGSVIEEVSID